MNYPTPEVPYSIQDPTADEQETYGEHAVKIACRNFTVMRIFAALASDKLLSLDYETEVKMPRENGSVLYVPCGDPLRRKEIIDLLRAPDLEAALLQRV